MTISRLKCPSCKALVVSDSENLTIAHKTPECDWFKKVCAEHGGSPGTEALIDVETCRQIGNKPS